ncbi:MAG: SDR family oxidoreductase [Planctomycetota bacterium]|nr:SDR family oxidoreductase [Planctomycetaceae bacterium]MDQ3332497.1 SDR family oxidoreductase [Planctomycetota bacterium]
MHRTAPLSGRTAIVTGAAVRLGRAISVALADAGADIVVHYGRSKTEAEEVAGEIAKLDRRVVTVSADLSDPLSAAAKILDAAAELGGADILVNSAAIFEDASLVEMTEDSYDRHLAINLKAPCFLCREFARRLTRDRGHILNLADWRAETPPADYLAYTLSKAGIVALTRALALQLAPAIQVNAIAPGAILPPPGGDFETWQTSKLPDIPLRRTGGAKDIADAAVYLLRSEFITGEVLHVTGGEHL